MWQHVKLSDASLGTRPRYSLVVVENVKKPKKQTSDLTPPPLFFFFLCSHTYKNTNIRFSLPAYLYLNFNLSLPCPLSLFLFSLSLSLSLSLSPSLCFSLFIICSSTYAPLLSYVYMPLLFAFCSALHSYSTLRLSTARVLNALNTIYYICFQLSSVFTSLLLSFSKLSRSISSSHARQMSYTCL